jgi:hypothetical protein
MRFNFFVQRQTQTQVGAALASRANAGNPKTQAGKEKRKIFPISTSPSPFLKGRRREKLQLTDLGPL